MSYANPYFTAAKLSYESFSSTDDAIQETRALYQLAGKIANIGFWEWDEVSDKCIYCSEELADIHGVNVEEFLLLSTSNAADRRWIHQEDRTKYESVARQFHRDHIGFQIEYRLIRADGTIAEVSEVVAPIVDNGGQLQRSIGFVKDITSRKNAELALQKITDLFSQTEALANIGHWEWDEVSDTCIYCSEELARLHGVTVDDFVAFTNSSSTDLEWIYPDDRADYLAASNKYLAEPKRCEIEYRLQPMNGNPLHVREVCAPVFDKTNKLINSIGYVQDVSSERRTTDRLRQARDELESRVRERTSALSKANEDLMANEQRLRDATRIAKLGWFKWDATANRGVYCDGELANILGVPVAECMNETMDQYIARIHVDDRDRVKQDYADAIAIFGPVDIEYRLITPAGIVRHVHEISHPEIDTDGIRLHTFGTLQDITDRTTISEELADVEQRLHELSANSREVFSILSANWRQVLYVNPAFENISGYGCKELLADADIWKNMLHPDDRDTIISEMHDKISDRNLDPSFTDYRIVRKDNTIRWISARVYPIRDTTGKILRFAGVAEDITERRAAVDALHQAQKSDAIGQLTSGIAHDFNNLLAVVIGNAGLLQGRLNIEDDKLVNEVIEAGHRGAELTKRLLAYSRQQPLKPVRSEINKLVSGMGELLRRTLGNGIVVELDLIKDVVYAMVDPSLLESAILNLALNARDAMPNGGKLTIGTSRCTKRHESQLATNNQSASSYMSIVVRDNGVGMSSEESSRAVEPFYTSKNTGDGNGLGLPMVYGFAKQSDGDLLIDSHPGTGTSVTIYLPCSI